MRRGPIRRPGGAWLLPALRTGRAPLLAALVPLFAALAPPLAAPAARSGAGQGPDAAKPAERLDRAVPAAPRVPGTLGPGERATLRDGRDLFLEVRIGPGDTYRSMGRKYLAAPDHLRALQEINGPEPPAAGGTIRIPYALLGGDIQARVMRDLFPDDGPRDGSWIHRVGAGRIAVTDESLWNIALWYTGRGENFEILADRNALPDLGPRAGQEIVIPGNLLLPPFAAGGGRPAGRSAAAGGADRGDDATAADDDFTEAHPGEEPGEEGPPPQDLRPVPPAPGAEDLSYGGDVGGRFAIYRLKRGEALYSSVVVRYTGRLDATDVNDLALQIARRSDIHDVTDIPIGFQVRIPLDVLLPEYLPPGDPRRMAWERGVAEVARYSNQARSRNLEGVAVILDAGHGGIDRGASHNGVWEHDYVYDVLCRIKALLETRTQARVLTTIKDRGRGYAIHDGTRLPRSRAEVLLTDPPLRLERGRMSVNLRWYLSNSYYRRLVAEGFDPLKIVFTSLHADARHPSLRGAMVYVPGEEYRRGRYGHGGAVYARYREVREEPFVRFARADRERSEGLSRQFAASLVTSFGGRGIPVHPDGPVRERIIRGGRSWVPAVLRCNLVPVQVLIELNNLSNPADSRLAGSPAHRQQVAEAYVEALNRYYGDRRPDGKDTAARRGR